MSGRTTIIPGRTRLTLATPSVESSGGGGGGLTPIANNTVLGNVSGVPANPSALSQAQLTALIQNFTPTLAGDVPPSGGGTTKFLRADGSWAAPPGASGTLTVGTTAIAGGATGQVLYDNAGILGEYTQAGLTAYISNFTSTTPGTVPSSGGGTTNFLRADGTWVAPPGSGGGTNITIGTTTIAGGISGRVLYDNAGLAGEYTPAQLTAAISTFTSTLSGAVPASGGGTNTFLRADGSWAAAPWSAPQGRLTLTTGVPVLTANVSAATTVFYTAYAGNSVPVFVGGAGPFMVPFATDLSQTLADTTKSPAATVASGVYDMFVWWDATLPGLRCTRGPKWTSSTARATALQRTGGLLVNATAITNGPGAGAGTYVGTIATNASNQVDMLFGGAASGGSIVRLFVWNMYNRVNVVGATTDNGATYTYSSGTPRVARASNNNTLNFVSGLQEDGITVAYITSFQLASVIGSNGGTATSLDNAAGSDNAIFFFGQQVASASPKQATVAGHYAPQIGTHIIYATEGADGTNAVTFDLFSSNSLEMNFRM